MLQYFCAYCLVALETENRLVCSACHRRTYCSRSCQKLDWYESGQGHKVWCKYLCGEESIDWEVRLISPEKGLGVVALRDIPKSFKIMVDKRIKSDDVDSQHLYADLEPASGTPQEKFKLNCMKDFDDVSAVVCPRMARANHDCWSNGIFYVVCVGSVKAMVLSAVRNIAAGEEITVCYTDWISPSLNSTSMDQHHALLRDQWMIDCPETCPCYCPIIQRHIKKARDLNRMLADYCQLEDAFTSLSIAKTLLKLLKMVGYPLLGDECRVYQRAFDVTAREKEYQQEGLQMLQRKYEILCRMECEESDEAVKCKRWLDQPDSHPNWRV